MSPAEGRPRPRFSIRRLARIISHLAANRFATGLAAAFCFSAANAQVIYSNSFGASAVTINQTAPNVAASLGGGSSGAKWICTYTNNAPAPINGTVLGDGTLGTNGGCALLPFKPQAGYVYYMTASLTVPSPMANWVAMGFAQAATQTNNAGYARFTDSPINGYAWVDEREGSTIQFFGGPKTSAGSPLTSAFPSAGTYTVQVVLNTLGANWSVAAYVNGAQIGTNIVYGANPSIAFAGIGQTSFAGQSVAGIRWNYWTLSTPLQPVITQQPGSQTFPAGYACSNTVTAVANSNGGPIACQWYFNSASNYIGASALSNSADGRVFGAHATTLVLTNIEPADAGYYYAVLTNIYGATTSSMANLAVLTNIVNNTNPPSRLASPDGSLVLTFAISNFFDGSASCPVYAVTRNGQTLITNSKLGLTFDDGGLLQPNLAILSQSNSSSDTTWQPVYAEKSSIEDNYNQLVVNLQETVSPGRLLQVTFRAYDEGAAFCYTVPSQPGFNGATNLTEQTEFRFTSNYPAWATYTAQGVYTQTTLSGITNGCERPLTVQLATNSYVSLGEARLVDYSRMKFAPLAGKPSSLISLLDGPVTNSLPLTTPWRFIMAADTAGQLLENDYFVLNLNDPCVLTNTSWIKPGKVIRDTTLTTAGGKACVDFAAQHNLSYIEFDAGWYGPENTTLTATNVIGSLDLPDVIHYATSNNIGVILYVNWLAMTNELTLLPSLYQSWGVKGIKYGFVSVGPQPFTEIVNSAAPLCASNQMMLEVHDEFRPSGYARTYPNFMSIEGVAGDETTPTTVQDTTSLFSRMLAGGADHTVCYFDSRVTNNWSYAYQLAKAVCFYSPWQYLYWYDRPTNSSGYVNGGDDMITEEPEMEFYDYMPTVWDETRVLQGSIGQYAIIARRAGAQWFIGAMNATSTRTFNVPLNFLTAGQEYVENIYSQDPSVPTRTQVRIDRAVVNSTGTLTMTLDASRGEAVRLLPANPPVLQLLPPLASSGSTVTITGDLSLPYSLWGASDPSTPATNWTLLNRGLITNSPFLWNDLLPLNQRFYRSSTP